MSASCDFTDCYTQHYAKLVRSLQLAGADDARAQDLAQEAFAITLRNWRRISTGSNPPGYVYRVAFRLLQKSVGREVPVSESLDSVDPKDPDIALRMTVEQALDKLPPKRRAVAVLTLVLGFSSVEVSALLGINDATARKHVEQARKSLQRWLE